MKQYICDICQKTSDKPQVIWDYGKEKHFCSFECCKEWLEMQIAKVKQDREPFEFLRDEVGMTD